MFRGIEWLFFDMESTLVDESFVYERRFRTIAEQAGKSYEAVYAYALNAFQKGKKGDKEAAKDFSVLLPAWTSEDECLYPDTLCCLENLSKRYKIGIIANQLPGCMDRLKNLGIWSYLDLLITSAEEGLAKPDPRIFELALKRSGCSAEHALMIGDRIDNDILPAKKLGMKTIWVKQGYGQYWSIKVEEEKPDGVVYSLKELLEVL